MRSVLVGAALLTTSCEGSLGFRPSERPTRVSVSGIERGFVVHVPATEGAITRRVWWSAGTDVDTADAEGTMLCEAVPCVVGDLEPATTYAVRVATADRTGESRPSAAVLALTLTGDELYMTRGWTYEAPGTSLGFSVAGAGDLDGDGFDDLAIGVPDAGAGGEVLVFRGGPDGPRSAPDRTLSGPTSSDFGWALSGAGDVNEDGYDDLAVGAPSFAGGGAGSVALFRGSPNGVATAAAWRGSTQFDGSASGAALATGEIDGDGRADVISGAPSWSGRGRVDVYRGPGPSSGSLYASASSAEGDESNAGFGGAIAAGDVDGDGLDELFIGSPTASGGGTRRGRVTMLRASGGGWAEVGSMSGTSNDSRLGWDVAFVGDVDGRDGADLLVSAAFLNTGGDFSAGRVLLLPVGSNGLGAPVWSMTGDVFFGNLGLAITAAGDLNADGFPDFAVGEPGAPAPGQDRGRVHVFFGSPDGPTRTIVFDGARVDGLFGAALAAAGDVDGDGFGDLLVGAPGAGRVDLLRGGRPLSAPRADAGYVIEGRAGEPISPLLAGFTDTVPDLLYSCTWEWGDGTVTELDDCRADQLGVAHVWAAGTYTVRLRVSASDGRVGEAVTEARIR